MSASAWCFVQKENMITRAIAIWKRKRDMFRVFIMSMRTAHSASQSLRKQCCHPNFLLFSTLPENGEISTRTDRHTHTHTFCQARRSGRGSGNKAADSSVLTLFLRSHNTGQYGLNTQTTHRDSGNSNNAQILPQVKTHGLTDHFPYRRKRNRSSWLPLLHWITCMNTTTVLQPNKDHPLDSKIFDTRKEKNISFVGDSRVRFLVKSPFHLDDNSFGAIKLRICIHR